MAVTALYNGKTEERDVDGITSIRTYSGTYAECTSYGASYTIGATYPLGVYRGYTVSQLGGNIWEVQLKFQNANGTSGTSYPVTPPDYTFGEYSATIDCSMMSTPLEIHKNAAGQFDYLCNWNQYLIGKYAKGGTAPDAPTWWSTLGADPSTGVISPIPQADQQTYQWADYGTLPIEDGYEFVVLKTPTMAGYQSYDRCLYTLTESARYRTYANAVAAIAGKANKTGTPTNNPGSPFVNGNWKCDRAQVEWTGEFWRATLTWTYSPDGWNSTLYQAIL
jgi:hypothetical protein